MMCAKKFLTNNDDEIIDIDPASEYEQIGDD